MPLKCIEFPVAVEQPVSVVQASRGNDDVYRAPNGHTVSTKSSKVASGFDRQFLTAERDLLQLSEQLSSFVEPTVVLESTQNLGQDQIAHNKTFDAEIAVMPPRFLALAGCGRSQSRRRSQQESLVTRHRVEVAFPFILPTQLPKLSLLPQAKQCPQAQFNSLPLGLDAGNPQRL